MESLDVLLRDASLIVKSDFGLELNESRLKCYSKSDWDFFCSVNGFDGSTDGLFVPESLTAYVNKDGDFFVSNVFHELFGHGLLAEQGLNNNPALSEGFAMWVEWYLDNKLLSEDYFWSKQTNYLKCFGNEYNNNINLVNDFINYSTKLTPKALLFNIGLPRVYSSNDLIDIVKQLYGSNFSDIELAVVYGSKKPSSDIDLFIIEKHDYNYFNDWLDIYCVSKDNAKTMVNNLDISVTDPLFSGELLIGEGLLNELCNEALNNPITDEAIKYNLLMSNEQTNFKIINQRDKTIAGLYSLSYKINANLLSKGVKSLTLKKLINNVVGEDTIC
ncbi:MAG: hypothetical protein WC307_04075 [Candidatus Nanoarchaeia archaeon]|jgi:hypothetical protein